MQCITLCLKFQHFWTGSTIFLFVEILLKTFCSLGYFLLYFLIVFSHLILNQNICTITLLTIAVINQRIIECIYMTRSLPDRWMHKNCRINTYNIIMKKHHTLPPILLDIVLQLYTVLTIIINGCQSIIDFT